VSALTRGLFGLACMALMAMLLAYVIEVVLRYFFNAPTRWSSAWRLLLRSTNPASHVHEPC
jgi:TRAP-type C4-dicarboxylate transport system permease small subunit